MGVQITELLVKHETSLDSFKNKIIAIDAFNVLYQFITTIRQRDGTPLMDSNGKITSHLNGLFYRTTNLMERGLKLVFVFDGDSPKLKSEERKRRQALKQVAEEKHKIALEARDIEGMKKYAGRFAKLNSEMIQEAKDLLVALGIPVIQAPSEGEAQASYMQKKGDVDYIASQDTDSLLFGANYLVRNLSITGKKKKTNALAFVSISPEIIELKENLKKLELTQDQLIVLAILVGTDFDVGGIKGIGPKNALKLVKKHGENFEDLFKEVNWSDFFDFSWKTVLNLFKEMPTIDDYELEWKSVDEAAVKKVLCENHGFNEERVDNVLKKVDKGQKKRSQTGLGDYL